MKKWMALLPAMALVAAMLVGCGGDDATGDGDEGNASLNNSPSAATTNASLPAKVCFACGQEAAEGCCESGTKCEQCDFVAGSFLCCTGLEKGEGALCTSCGEVAGGETCCAADAESCASCGLHKGAPLCCKLEKSAD